MKVRSDDRVAASQGQLVHIRDFHISPNSFIKVNRGNFSWISYL